MRGYNIGYRAYQEGMKYLRVKNYSMAKKWFKTFLKEVKSQSASLSKLIKIDLKEGDFKHARELMDQYYYFDSYYAFGLLEKVEYNFNASKDYYNSCIDPKEILKAEIANPQIEIELGNYDTALLQLNDVLKLEKNKKIKFGILSQIILIYAYIKEYDKASNILKEVNKKYQKIGVREQKKLAFLLEYLQGKQLKTIAPYQNDYIIRRMFDTNEELLLNHIKKHAYPSEKYQGYFLEGINFEELINEIQSKLSKKNPYHIDIIDVYNLRLEQPIGYFANELTSDISVSTFLGTKDIVTMYPIRLSNEYDKENLFTSEKLARKRQV